MCGGGYTFIEQEYPDFQYSNVRYALSEVKGGIATIDVPLSQENAAGVLIRGIQWDTLASDTVFAAPIQIFDSIGNVLVSSLNKGSYNEKNYFDYYIPKARSLKITASVGTIQILVEYQFLYIPSKNDKQHDS